MFLLVAVCCFELFSNVQGVLGSILSPLVRKTLYERFPEYHRWVDVSIEASFSVVGIVISLFLAK